MFIRNFLHVSALLLCLSNAKILKNLDNPAENKDEIHSEVRHFIASKKSNAKPTVYKYGRNVGYFSAHRRSMSLNEAKRENISGDWLLPANNTDVMDVGAANNTTYDVDEESEDLGSGNNKLDNQATISNEEVMSESPLQYKLFKKLNSRKSRNKNSNERELCAKDSPNCFLKDMSRENKLRKNGKSPYPLVDHKANHNQNPPLIVGVGNQNKSVVDTKGHSYKNSTEEDSNQLYNTLDENKLTFDSSLKKQKSVNIILSSNHTKDKKYIPFSQRRFLVLQKLRRNYSLKHCKTCSRSVKNNRINLFRKPIIKIKPHYFRNSTSGDLKRGGIGTITSRHRGVDDSSLDFVENGNEVTENNGRNQVINPIEHEITIHSSNNDLEIPGKEVNLDSQNISDLDGRDWNEIVNGLRDVSPEYNQQNDISSSDNDGILNHHRKLNQHSLHPSASYHVHTAPDHLNIHVHEYDSG